MAQNYWTSATEYDTTDQGHTIDAHANVFDA